VRIDVLYMDGVVVIVHCAGSCAAIPIRRKDGVRRNVPRTSAQRSSGPETRQDGL